MSEHLPKVIYDPNIQPSFYIDQGACAQVMSHWGMNNGEIEDTTLMVAPSTAHLANPSAPTEPGPLLTAKYDNRLGILFVHGGSMEASVQGQPDAAARELALSTQIAHGLSYCAEYNTRGAEHISAEKRHTMSRIFLQKWCQWTTLHSIQYSGAPAFSLLLENQFIPLREGGPLVWGIGSAIVAATILCAGFISRGDATGSAIKAYKEIRMAADWPIDRRAHKRAQNYAAGAKAGRAPLLVQSNPT